jgi:hypothetical protein
MFIAAPAQVVNRKQPQQGLRAALAFVPVSSDDLGFDNLGLFSTPLGPMLETRLAELPAAVCEDRLAY